MRGEGAASAGTLAVRFRHHAAAHGDRNGAVWLPTGAVTGLVKPGGPQTPRREGHVHILTPLLLSTPELSSGVVPRGLDGCPFLPSIHPTPAPPPVHPIRSDPTVRSDCIGASDFCPTLNFLPPAVALRLKLVARAFRLSESALALPAEILALS